MTPKYSHGTKKLCGQKPHIYTYNIHLWSGKFSEKSQKPENRIRQKPPGFKNVSFDYKASFRHILTSLKTSGDFVDIGDAYYAGRMPEKK